MQSSLRTLFLLGCGFLALCISSPPGLSQSGPVETATWTRIGPDGGSIVTLASDSAQPLTVYAATTSGGVFRSLDGGSSWSPANRGLGSLNVTGLAVDPSRGGKIFATTQAGLYVSTDAADSWQRVVGLGATGLDTPIVSPAAPLDVYCAGSSGVFRSLDDGATWSSIDRGLPRQGVTAFAASSVSPLQLYAGTDTGLYRSDDRGESWTPVDLGPRNGSHVGLVSVDPRNSQRLFVNLERVLLVSFDGGTTFINTISLPEPNQTLIDPAAPDVVYGGSSTGASQSVDGGLHWRFLNSGLPRVADQSPIAVQALLLLQQPSRHLLAGTPGGVFSFSLPDGPRTPSSGGLTPVVVNDVAVRPSAPSRILVASSDGLYRTVDKGQSWELSLFRGIGGLALDPNDSDRAYAGSAGVYRTVDGGDHWIRLSSGLTVGLFGQLLDVRSLAIDRNSPRHLIAGGLGGLFASDSGGDTWTRLGLTFSQGSPTAVAIDPISPTTIYTGTEAGVFKSDDGGQTFQLVNLVAPGADAQLASVSALAINPDNPSILYAGTSDFATGGRGVFRTFDGGELWTQVNRGLVNRQVRAVEIDPLLPSTVYAGTGSGVARSVDGGDRWSLLTTLGIEDLRINSVRLDTSDSASPPSLLAGTQGQGLYRLTLPNVGTFAQYGDGATADDFFSSELILFNPATDHPANATLLLRGDQGTPFEVGIDGVRINGRLDLNVPSRSVRVRKSDGDGPIRSGWAALYADLPLEAVVLFESVAGSAGVVGGPAFSGGFVIPVRSRAAQGIRMGLAIANMTPGANRVDLELFGSDRQLLGQAEITLPGLGHEAVFIDQIPWIAESGPIDFSHFLGLVSARGQGPVTAIAIQTQPGEFATFPVIDEGDDANPKQGVAASLHFPHFANGSLGSQQIVSTLLLVNKSPLKVARAVIEFRDGEGSPVGSTLFPGTGDALELEIPPGGIRALETDGLGTVLSGSVTVSTDQPLDGVLLYTGKAGAAGVGVGASFEDGFAAPVQTDLQSHVDTGLAIMNLEADAATVDLILRDRDGLELAVAKIDLPARGQRALFVDQLDWMVEEGSSLDFSGFTGFVEAHSSGRSAAVVIRTRPTRFAVFPVASLPHGH